MSITGTSRASLTALDMGISSFKVAASENGEPGTVSGTAERLRTDFARDLNKLDKEHADLVSKRFTLPVIGQIPRLGELEKARTVKVVKSNIDNETRRIEYMTMLYRRVTLVSRFRSGRFPSADALRDVQSLTMEEVAKFHPDGLRKTYAPYVRTGNCANTQCNKHSDAIEGDSSFHRQEDLREICSDVLQISLVDKKDLSKKRKMAERLRKVQDDYIIISNEVIATTVYFYHSQFETRSLINSFATLTSKMQDFLETGFGSGATKNDDRLEDEIKQVLTVVKSCIADVIHHHDRVFNELKAAKDKALSGHCDEQLCRTKLAGILSGKIEPNPETVFGWICRKCIKFSYKELHALLLECGQNVVDLSVCNATPEKSFIGGFGAVSIVDLKQLDANIQNTFKCDFGSKVAMKELSVDTGEGCTEARYCQRFLREIIVWKQLKHQNLVPLLGTCMNPHKSPGPLLVTPYIKDGDLEVYIQTKPQTDESMLERLGYMRDVASALEYMHTHNLRIVHGDLKPNNILIHYDEKTGAGRAYLADFGLSILANYRGMTTDVHGSPCFMAPELCEALEHIHHLSDYEHSDFAKPTTWSDMYAFGCTFYHVMTKELPFTNKHRSWRNRTIPSKHNDIKIARHYYFMRKCWEIYPAVRPTAKAANETMTEFIGDIKLLIPPQTH